MLRHLLCSLRRVAPLPVLAVALLAVGLRVGLAYATHFTQEDFLITLRYAENIAHGRGFVYNAGERVLGTTTPLYTLLLAGLLRLGLPAMVIGKAANILADGALCIVAYRWLSLAGQETAGLAAAFLLAVNPVEMRVAISGQESSLVALGGALAWLLYAQRRYGAAAITAALLFLLRWDSLLLTAVLAGAAVLRERRVPWREVGAGLLVCAPWLVFATCYFGSPIPGTLAAKSTVYGWYFRAQTMPELPRLLFRLWGAPLYALTALSTAVGIARIVRERWIFMVPPLLWFALYWLAFVVSKVWLFEWYLVPPLFVYLACAAVGAVTVCSRVRGPWVSAAQALIGVGCLALCVMNFRETVAFTRGSQSLEDHLRRPLGLWLRAHAAPTDHILMEPIGYIGYYSQRRVIDLTGLVSPSVVRFYRTRPGDPFRAILDTDRPEWCVLRPDEETMMAGTTAMSIRRWRRDYPRVATFSYAVSPDAPTVFNVYRRAQPASPATVKDRP